MHAEDHTLSDMRKGLENNLTHHLSLPPARRHYSADVFMVLMRCQNGITSRSNLEEFTRLPRTWDKRNLLTPESL